MAAEDIQCHLNVYCKAYHINPPFVVSDPWDVLSGSAPAAQGSVYDHTSPGCYLFYSEDGRLLYTGKASMKNTLGGRVASWFNPPSSATPAVLRHLDRWPILLPQARSIRTIKVSFAHKAPSLKEFLIFNLQPPANKLRVKS